MMTNMLDLGALSVNEVISRYPATIEVFNRYAIDACCGGAASIIDASIRDAVNAEKLLEELLQVIARAA